MKHTFETPEPVRLVVVVRSGDVTVVADEVDTTTVELRGNHAEDVVVEQRDDLVAVAVPRSPLGFRTENSTLSVRVVVPQRSSLRVKSRSAAVSARGCFGATEVTSGSGRVDVDRVEGDAVIEVGSGEIHLARVTGHARVKSGSGDVSVDHVGGTLGCSVGSGDVLVGTSESDVSLKSGSGDLRVRQASGALSLVVASGDVTVDRLLRGSLKATAVSGDLAIGIPVGTPVWTDISSVTGSIRSDLESTGRPAPGQDHVEIRASSVSGDVRLHRTS